MQETGERHSPLPKILTNGKAKQYISVQPRPTSSHHDKQIPRGARFFSRKSYRIGSQPCALHPFHRADDLLRLREKWRRSREGSWPSALCSSPPKIKKNRKRTNAGDSEARQRGQRLRFCCDVHIEGSGEICRLPPGRKVREMKHTASFDASASGSETNILRTLWRER